MRTRATANMDTFHAVYIYFTLGRADLENFSVLITILKISIIIGGDSHSLTNFAILEILHLRLLRISPQQQISNCADLNSVVFFLLSFVAIYSLNETYISLF